MTVEALSPAEVKRFWSHVDKNGPVPEHKPDLGPCWVWTASTRWGYGQFGGGGGRLYRAHRFAYENPEDGHSRHIPDSFDLDHLCHNDHPTCPGGVDCLHRRCVNPSHLEAVTHRENLLRGKTISARAAKATHCPHGHAYDAVNTVITNLGHRRCRTCQNAGVRRWYAEKTRAASA